jgi:hypothetical protein
VATRGAYETELLESFDFALREASAYFMKQGRLHESLHRLATRLEAEQITYALVGGMALGEHGYVRMTEAVDVLLTREGLEAFRQRLVGRGYLATHPGATRAFRDTESGVRIEILVSGEFPGDGKPKPVRFPDPTEAMVDAENLRVLPLAKIVELKLASGMTAPHRLRDLADVQELIKNRGLDEGFASQLDESVRATYLELYRATQTTSGA